MLKTLDLLPPAKQIVIQIIFTQSTLTQGSSELQKDGATNVYIADNQGLQIVDPTLDPAH